MNYLKFKPLNYFAFAFVTIFVSLILSCKSKEETAPLRNLPPTAFNVIPSLSPSGQDVILHWDKSKDPEGDLITYSVVYKDTLIKNLSDTTYTIKNIPFDTEITGTVVAKDSKGNKTVSLFIVKTVSEYVNIPDLNFEKYLIKNRIDDVQDGKVSRKSVANVSEIKFNDFYQNPNDKIKNLTGLEAFVNLKELECYYTILTDLDLSKNFKLVYIDLYYNKLSGLDVTQNTALAFLACRDNKISKLDVSKNVALTHLDCKENQLNTLDISKNLFLTHIDCSYNQLDKLDVSKQLSLDSLYCSHNKLSNLDTSKNTSLSMLDCGDNPSLIFDVSKNIKLNELGCNANRLSNLDVSKNVNLVCLSCDFNQLKSLNIENNIVLNFLYCGSNQLTSLDVSKNTNLMDLECAYNKLTSLDFRTNKTLTDLFCQFNMIQTICVNSLTQPKTTWRKDFSATYKVCP